MSTISIVLGTIRLGFTNPLSLARRSSGTVMTPTLGSMVQNGKFAACAFALERQLNKVDLPTLGKPTIPHWRAMKDEVYIIKKRCKDKNKMVMVPIKPNLKVISFRLQ